MTPGVGTTECSSHKPSAITLQSPFPRNEDWGPQGGSDLRRPHSQSGCLGTLCALSLNGKRGFLSEKCTQVAALDSWQMGLVSGLAYSDSSSLVSFRLSRNVSSRRSSSPKGRWRREVTWQMRTRARASYRPRKRETTRTGSQFAFKNRDVNSRVMDKTQILETS